MTKRKYRTYPDEFKLEVLELLKTSGKSSAADRTGIGDHTRTSSQMAE